MQVRPIGFIFALAIIVLLIGSGASLILSSAGWLLFSGYCLVAIGLGLGAVSGMALGRYLLRKQQDKSPLDLAEETLDRNMRGRHLRATEQGLPHTLDTENTTSRRQEARAQRVINAAKSRDS